MRNLTEEIIAGREREDMLAHWHLDGDELESGEEDMAARRPQIYKEKWCHERKKPDANG
jgi:hypothetical protein